MISQINPVSHALQDVPLALGTYQVNVGIVHLVMFYLAQLAHQLLHRHAHRELTLTQA